MTASIYLMIAVAIERYIAVNHPHQFRFYFITYLWGFLKKSIKKENAIKGDIIEAKINNNVLKSNVYFLFFCVNC